MKEIPKQHEGQDHNHDDKGNGEHDDEQIKRRTDEQQNKELEEEFEEAQAVQKSNKGIRYGNSCLETLVRLCSLARCYQFEPLFRQALSILKLRSKEMRHGICGDSTDEKVTSLATEIKGAIREAWGAGRHEAKVRGTLLQLSMATSRHSGLQESFLALVDEVPAFAVDFSKATFKYFSSGPADQAKHVLHPAVQTPATSIPAPAPPPKLAPSLFENSSSGGLFREPTRIKTEAPVLLTTSSN